MLVLDISCQHMGDECKLKSFCAPFGRRVGECTFLKLYICIGYMLPTFGEHTSVEFIHCSRAKLSGAQLSTFWGRTVGPRTVGPLDSWAPDSWAPGQLGPGQLGPRTVGPRTIGPRGPTVRPEKVDCWAPRTVGPWGNVQNQLTFVPQMWAAYIQYIHYKKYIHSLTLRPKGAQKTSN